MPNETLKYRSDVFLSTPVAIELPACDWIALMVWFTSQNLTGVTSIVMGDEGISEQVVKACFTTPSIDQTQLQFEQRYGVDRCAVCQRVIGMPTTPCQFCPDAE